MSKVFWVAWREFLATVATKGFIIGVLLTPVLMGVAVIGIATLMNEKPPEIRGELELVDLSGRVAAGVEAYLSPEALARRHGEQVAAPGLETIEQLAEAPSSAEAATDAAEALDAFDPRGSAMPEIRVIALPPEIDVEARKPRLREGSAQDGGLLALAVVHDDAVEKTPQSEGYGSYDLFVREKLDDRIEDEIKDGLKHAIIDARVSARGLDRAEIEALTRVKRVRSVTVSERGERKTNEVFNVMLPAGFMVLLLVSVFTSGQYIMTTTVEEKSSRVVELLLSAVSPMQLMTGKIIGQLLVGLSILGLYSAMGIGLLVAFAVFGVVDPSLFVYLVLFYLIAYFVIGSLMAAIGAAVNEMREAQTLLMPVMVVVMIPWLLWMPITRDPNSVFATVTSFIPPINTFVMLLRLTSTAPPPTWQVWLSIAIGAASVYVALWFTAKVFRVGLLMYGKPPSFATLVRWVRMS